MDELMPELPLLPYAGTSGWSGSETSKARAEDADRSGSTSLRQAQTQWLLHKSRTNGMTWRDLSEATGWHHGTASGALSVLHKCGTIARLSERRNKCLVYVLPEYVNGRETTPYRQNMKNTERKLVETLTEVEACLKDEPDWWRALRLLEDALRPYKEQTP